MGQFTEDFQNLGLLLLLCFSIALIAAGILLMKTRFLDAKGKEKKKAEQSGSVGIGRLIIILGSILAFISLLFLIFISIGVS